MGVAARPGGARSAAPVDAGRRARRRCGTTSPAPGIDAVWLMGVWERSPAGAAIAREHPAMAAAQRAALPDVTDDDVVGSAYCIRDYRVDERLGGDDGLAAARRGAGRARRRAGPRLRAQPRRARTTRGRREHPEYFVRGTPDDLAADPDSFLAVGDAVIARGRDPYFPAWPEVLQLDASRADAAGGRGGRRRRRSPSACDGVRCDMAMLVLDDVFVRTWGERAAGGPSPDGGRGYWPTVIGAVRSRHPDFVFWAEAYWDLEPVLVEQGFDACYDKRLYDRLVAPRAGVVDPRPPRRRPGVPGAHRALRREPRRAARWPPCSPPPAARAAAVVALTLPGRGPAARGPGRRPAGAGAGHARPAARRAARRRARGRGTAGCWRALGARTCGAATWALVAVDGWPDNRSCEHLVGVDVDGAGRRAPRRRQPLRRRGPTAWSACPASAPARS